MRTLLWRSEFESWWYHNHFQIYNLLLPMTNFLQYWLLNVNPMFFDQSKRTKNSHLYWQCNQIGIFFGLLGTKFSNNSSKNILVNFWAILNSATFMKKKWFGYFLGNICKNWATVYSVIWSHFLLIECLARESTIVFQPLHERFSAFYRTD